MRDGSLDHCHHSLTFRPTPTTAHAGPLGLQSYLPKPYTARASPAYFLQAACGLYHSDRSKSFSQGPVLSGAAPGETGRGSSEMAGSMQRWRHRVHGFGSHVEMRTVEFVDKLECWQVCSWCGLVCLNMHRAECQHIICEICRCYGTCRSGSLYATCCDYERLCSKFEPGHLGDKRVRCVNAGSGCDFVGPLGHLDEHLRESCARYWTGCLRCGDTVAHKDMRIHYSACGGRRGIFLRSADARSLLDNFGAACERLENAVASASPDSGSSLRNAVKQVREQFTRIQGQLASGTPWHVRKCAAPRLGK